MIKMAANLKSVSERTAEITLELRAKDTLAKLTPAGREFMRLVGSGHFDFFDDGIVEHSGNWGENMAAQASSAMGKNPRSMGGIMGRLAKPELGLWVVDMQDGNHGPENWWSLTALGAAVALAAAGKLDGVAGKDGGSWKSDGQTEAKPQPAEKRTRNDLVKAIRAAGHTGPVTGKHFPTVAEVAALAQKLGV